MDGERAQRPGAVAAPPVVAVVVVHAVGPWFEDCLESLAHQDYPALSTVFLVADGADTGDHDVVGRIRAVLPDAFVEELGSNPGFGPAANTVAQFVEGDNGFFCFCHDDVALDPDAVRTDDRGAVPLQRRNRRPQARDVGQRPCAPGRRARRRPFRPTGQPSRRRRGRPGAARRGDRRVRRSVGLLAGPRRPVPCPWRVRRGDELLRRGRRPLLARPHQRCARDGCPQRPRPSPWRPRGAATRPQPHDAAGPSPGALDAHAHGRQRPPGAAGRARRRHHSRARRRRVQWSRP